MKHRRQSNAFARGDKSKKLGPRYPYLSGGYNQRTERQAAAIEAQVMGHDKNRRVMSKREEKKAVAIFERFEKHYDEKEFKELGRRQRKMIRSWWAEMCRQADHKLWLNAQ